MYIVLPGESTCLLVPLLPYYEGKGIAMILASILLHVCEPPLAAGTSLLHRGRQRSTAHREQREAQKKIASSLCAGFFGFCV